MITNFVAHEKSQLIENISTTQKQIAHELLQNSNHQSISHLIFEWHSHQNYFMTNADLTKISLKELEEKHKQVVTLLKKSKESTSI